MTTSNLLAFLGLIVAILGGLWGVYAALVKKIEEVETISSDKIKRIYERMDENKDTTYKTFVLKEVHEEMRKHQTELNDQKFTSLIELFKTNFLYVTTEIKAMRAQLNHKGEEQ